MALPFPRFPISAFVAIYALSANHACAWLRYYAPDDELINRSEAIVIGHISSGFAPDEAKSTFSPPPGATNWHFMQYRATLLVSESIKGDVKPGSIPLVIHYGLQPVLLNTGRKSFEDALNPVIADEKAVVVIPVGIHDSATTCIGGPPSDDIHQDHIWFLRKKVSSVGGVQEDFSVFGIRDPQDVQPIDKRSYYLAVLTGDPEALAPWVAGKSWQAQQAQRTQSRLFVTKLNAISNVEERATKLAAYIDSVNDYTSARELAFKDLLDTGEVGESKLLAFLRDKPRAYDRRFIVMALGQKRYLPAAPVMLKWLVKENEWWADKTKDDFLTGYAGQKGGDPYHDPRAVSFRNIYCTIEALGYLGATEAKPAIRRTREIWNRVGVVQENNNILALCDEVFGSGR